MIKVVAFMGRVSFLLLNTVALILWTPWSPSFPLSHPSVIKYFSRQAIRQLMKVNLTCIIIHIFQTKNSQIKLLKQTCPKSQTVSSRAWIENLYI